jgi:death on curing protein
LTQDSDDLAGAVRYLSVEDLIDLNRALIQRYTPDEQSGVFYLSGLESAQQRPAHYRYYKQSNDLIMLGAVLFTGLIQNHAFHSGNKRTAFAACRMFLLLNGALFDPPLHEVLDVSVAVANHELEDAQVASWISWHTRPIDCSSHLAEADRCIDILADWSDG